MVYHRLERLVNLPVLALVLPDSGGGGIYQYAQQLKHALIGHMDVHVVLADPYSSAGLGEGGAGFDNVEFEADWRVLRELKRGPLSPFPQTIRMLATAFGAWRKVKELNPDVVELCDWPLSFAPAVLDQSIPYVVQCHGSMGQIAQHDPQAGNEFERAVVQLLEPQLISAAHSVQTYSSSNANFWEGVAGRSVNMIRAPFTLPDMSDSDVQVVESGVVFGRLQRWKGPHVLCAALRNLGQSAPRIDWYGGVKPWDSSDWPTDRRLAADYPDVWGTTLCHHDALPRQQVGAIQSRALFNVVPSTWDVFNFTAVEAMAAGRPTIVSTAAGASELIVDGENGFLFESEDPLSLSAAIERIMTMSETQRAQIGKAGRHTIGTTLDPAVIAEQRVSAYNEVMRSFETARPAKPNAWISDLISPRADANIDPAAFLESVPMRTLARHLKDRTMRKLKGSRS